MKEEKERNLTLDMGMTFPPLLPSLPALLHSLPQGDAQFPVLNPNHRLVPEGISGTSTLSDWDRSSRRLCQFHLGRGLIYWNRTVGNRLGTVFITTTTDNA